MDQAPPTPLRILVLDDDPLIGRVARRALGAAGHTVRVCQEVDDARDAMAADPASVDVLLIDMRLGSDWGPDVAVELRRLSPGLPVVLASGDARGARACGDIGPPARFLAKPFRMRELAQAVQDVVSITTPAAGS